MKNPNPIVACMSLKCAKAKMHTKDCIAYGERHGEETSRKSKKLFALSVSRWKSVGKERGYWKYFEDEVRRKLWKELKPKP